MSSIQSLALNPAASQDPTGEGASPRPGAAAMGAGRFFAGQNFHFQALRALMEAPSGSADVNEVLETLKRIRDGDQQGWFEAWETLSQQTLSLAQATLDPISKSDAFMRAHNYRRTAEFLLPPDDPKRPASWEKSLKLFDDGIAASSVRLERMRVPYESAALRAHYFPGPEGAETKLLIMMVGGYDSVLEELYPFLGKPALARGYSVLAYEGPGQGQALRDGLTFTHEWENPTAAVLDAFLATHAQPRRIVLIGMSMGGYLAPRAAAFEPRIDGVVAWDTCFDFAGCAAPILALAADPRTARIPDVAWAYENAKWTMGARDIADTTRAVSRYTLAPVADRIRQDVLIMAGEADHFIPARQTADFEASLVNAKSVTTRWFSRASGGGEHCQTGALTLVHATIFDWLLSKFGDHGA